MSVGVMNASPLIGCGPRMLAGSSTEDDSAGEHPGTEVRKPPPESPTRQT